MEVKLDFSKLDAISYRGFDTEEAREQKDKMLQEGYTIVEGPTPFDEVEATPRQNNAIAVKKRPQEPREGQGAITPPPALQRPSERKITPFLSMDGKRNYRAMYRAACNYHEKYSPPIIGNDEGLSYWHEAAEEIGQISASFGNDPFIMGLLSSVYEELEREYKYLRDKEQGEQLF